MIRTILVCGLYWGPFILGILGNSQIMPRHLQVISGPAKFNSATFEVESTATILKDLVFSRPTLSSRKALGDHSLSYFIDPSWF